MANVTGAREREALGKKRYRKLHAVASMRKSAQSEASAMMKAELIVDNNDYSPQLNLAPFREFL